MKSLSVWGSLEHDDLKDITSKLERLINKQLDAETKLTDTFGEYREKMKEIKKREKQIFDQNGKLKNAEKALADAKRKQKGDQDQLQFQKGLHEEELKRMLAEHEGLKRKDMLESFSMYFGALQLAIAARFGNHLVNQIPQGTLLPGQTLPSYNDYEAECDGKRKETNETVASGSRQSPELSVKGNSPEPRGLNPSATLASVPFPPVKANLKQRMSAMSLSANNSNNGSVSGSNVSNNNQLRSPDRDDDTTSQVESHAPSFLDQFSNSDEPQNLQFQTVSRPFYNSYSSSTPPSQPGVIPNYNSGPQSQIGISNYATPNVPPSQPPQYSSPYGNYSTPQSYYNQNPPQPDIYSGNMYSTPYPQNGYQQQPYFNNGNGYPQNGPTNPPPPPPSIPPPGNNFSQPPPPAGPPPVEHYSPPNYNYN
ncbi:hypothetical protein HDU97_000367 [Phlyctochytrium planicorne]|nr:hypothetical protein HDU97_000367 [Phlyctochytrium planicorne]